MTPRPLILASFALLTGACGSSDYDATGTDGKSDSADALQIKGKIGFGNVISSEFDASKLHGYSFNGKAGEEIELVLTADAEVFTDTIVYLYGPKEGESFGAEPIAEDDDGGPNRFSHLTHKLSADGEYLVVASALNYSYTGRTYELDMNCNTEGCGPKTTKWTSLVYGAYDTHDDGGIPSSLMEMAFKVTRNNEDISLLYLEDGPGGPNTRLWEVNSRKFELVRDFGELHVGQANTLKDMLTYVANDYPSEQFFLNLVGHTNSGIAAFLPDYFPAVSNWEDERMMYWQIRDAILEAGVPVDVLGLSGCGTADLELVASMQDTADYIVGLQEYNLGYTDVRWADSLMRNSAITPKGLARRVAAGMFKKGFFDQKSPGATGAFETSQLPLVETAFAELNATLIAKVGTSEAGLVRTRKETLQMQSGALEFMVDAGDFANKLISFSNDAEIEAKAAAFKNALDAMLVGGGVPNYADEGNHAEATGINLVFMSRDSEGRVTTPADFDEASAWPEAETSFYESTGWREFVTELYPSL